MARIAGADTGIAEFRKTVRGVKPTIVITVISGLIAVSAVNFALAAAVVSVLATGRPSLWPWARG